MNEITLNLNGRELLTLAFALSGSATGSYVDGRLCTAATEHALAAKLWAAANSPTNAERHRKLAAAIDLEMIEAANAMELEG